jgi:hypothetical protein
MPVVWPASAHSSPSVLERLADEYGLKDQLDGVRVVHALELARECGRTMLVLKDPDAVPLERLVGAPMAMGRFFTLANDIATALGKSHQRGLVFMGVTPANILGIGANGAVRLSGSRRSRRSS